MPWRGSNFSFTENAILTNAPNNSGVYAIWGTQGSNGTVYIGESNDVQRRLLEHRRATGTCIAGYAPTTCGVELVPSNQRMRRQNELIAELHPYCTGG